jgi:hypothetical protein
MLSFLKKIFGVKPAAKTSVPYKVETPADAPKAKKPTVKKATTAKSRKPRTPKV